MYYGQPIHISHLIAIMVYCNYDTLQQKFSETFRRLNAQETNEELKKKHSNYHYLARYLRECVECFGMQYKKETEENYMNVYHGVCKQFMFSSVYAFIKGPLSTTTDYAVAVNFCASYRITNPFNKTANQLKYYMNSVNGE
eukprot:481254_1